MDVPIPEFLETLFSGVLLTFILHLLLRIVFTTDYQAELLPAALHVVCKTAVVPRPAGGNSSDRFPSGELKVASPDPAPSPAPAGDSGWADPGRWIVLSACVALVYLLGIFAQAAAEWMYHDARWHLPHLLGSEHEARMDAFFRLDRPNSLFVQYSLFRNGELLVVPYTHKNIAPLRASLRHVLTHTWTDPAKTRTDVLSAVREYVRRASEDMQLEAPAEARSVATSTYLRAKSRVLREPPYGSEMLARQNRIEFLQAAVPSMFLGSFVAFFGLVLRRSGPPSGLIQLCWWYCGLSRIGPWRGPWKAANLSRRVLWGHLIAFLLLYAAARVAWRGEVREFANRAYGYFLTINQDPPVTTTRPVR